MPPQQQQQPQGMTLDDKIHCIVALGQFAAKPIEAFLRVPGTVGRRYFNYQALVGGLAMFLWIANWHPVHAVYAFYATFGMFIMHAIARWWTLPETHSMYTGRPWLPGEELSVKGFWEILLVGLGGLLLLDASFGLGTWLLASAAVSRFRTAITR